MALRATYVTPGKSYQNSYITVSLNSIRKDVEGDDRTYFQSFVAFVTKDGEDGESFRDVYEIEIDPAKPSFKQAYDYLKTSPKYLNAVKV